MHALRGGGGGGGGGGNLIIGGGGGAIQVILYFISVLHFYIIKTLYLLIFQRRESIF